MPKYMLLIGQKSENVTKPVSLEGDQVMNMYKTWTEKMHKAGIFESAHKLFMSRGRRLEKDAARGIVDGPFSEAKEIIGGYYVIDVPSYEDAAKWAKECPSLLHENCYVEVREVEM